MSGPADHPQPRGSWPRSATEVAVMYCRPHCRDRSGRGALCPAAPSLYTVTTGRRSPRPDGIRPISPRYPRSRPRSRLATRRMPFSSALRDGTDLCRRSNRHPRDDGDRPSIACHHAEPVSVGPARWSTSARPARHYYPVGGGLLRGREGGSLGRGQRRSDLPIPRGQALGLVGGVPGSGKSTVGKRG